LDQGQQDPDADSWYVVVVKARSELYCRQYLTSPGLLPYQVEVYVASQQEVHFYSNRTRRTVEHIVIPGKIFIRVDGLHRQDVLKRCPMLSHYLIDPARNPTEQGFRNFARVPDAEICRLREILTQAEGPVEYTADQRPHPGEKVQVLTGRFSGLTGVVLEEGGNRFAIVRLDKLGSFRFKLPTKDLGQITPRESSNDKKSKNNTSHV
jgi:transcription antitermination factor NusG